MQSYDFLKRPWFWFWVFTAILVIGIGTAFAVSLNDKASSISRPLRVVSLMLAAGVLGAAVNLALSAEVSLQGEEHRNVGICLTAIISGIGAAFLTPVFLHTTSSKLLVGMLESTSGSGDWFLFFGICLVAAISAKSFIPDITQKLLKEVKEAKAEASEARQEAGTALVTAEQVSSTVQKVGEASQAAIMISGVTEGNISDDPWKGALGGLAEANQRRLSATVTEIEGLKTYCQVNLVVVSTAPVEKLQGYVQFLLHPAFANDKPIVAVDNGQAQFSFFAWGAFTVGALADQGATKLELDLSELPDAPDWWKKK